MFKRLPAFLAIITTLILAACQDPTLPVVIDPPVDPALPISLLEISGIPAPVTGETPYSATIDTTEYTATVSWNPSHDIFEVDTVYTAIIEASPKTGYTLEGLAANSFTVQGAVASCAADSGTVEAVYPATEKPAVTETKFNYAMVFDCSRRVDTVKKEFTALMLNTPKDDAMSTKYGPYYNIAELDAANVAYKPTYYITLDITTAADGDTIEAAKLNLRNEQGEMVREISANGTIEYLGAEGFIYISAKSSAGYFFSSTARDKGSSVTYPYTMWNVTKMSDMGW